MDKKPPLHISPYSLIAKITRSYSDTLRAFLQCGKDSKFGSTFSLIWTYLSSKCMGLCNLVTNYINAKLS